MNKTIEPGTLTGTVEIPASKSVVHRLLICAALGKKPVKIELRGISEDIKATAACLNNLGMSTEVSENDIKVFPVATGENSAEMPRLPCGESGSTLRFMIPVVGALGREACFVMKGRLSERPLRPFNELLCEKGMQIRRDDADGEKRLCCSGQLRPGRFLLPGNISSQFFTGLLLALPLLDGDSDVRAEGASESEGYLRITENVLRSAGIVFEKTGPAEWYVPGGQSFRLSGTVAAEGDWSGAAFPLCLGALSKTGVVVRGLDLNSAQGDRAILGILREFGAVTECEEGFIRTLSNRKIPMTIDAGPIPDLIPALSVLLCATEGESRIINASRLRLKESDRLTSTAMMLRSLGGTVEELTDSLIIHGTGRLRGGTVDACGDHRIAMSAAVAAAMCESPVTVLGAECVAKSYPDFWDHLEELRTE